MEGVRPVPGVSSFLPRPAAGVPVRIGVRKSRVSAGVPRAVRRGGVCDPVAETLCSGGGSGNGGHDGGSFGGGGDGGSMGPSDRDRTFVFWALVALSATCAPSAYARSKKKVQETPSVEVYSKRLADLYWPVLHNLGFSGIVGWITAFFLKAVGKGLALLVGGLFAVIQVAAYMGFVEVKWTKLHEEVIKRLDVNKDGSFDASDFQSVLGSLLAILSQGVPSVGGFFAGFVLGLK